MERVEAFIKGINQSVEDLTRLRTELETNPSFIDNERWRDHAAMVGHYIAESLSEYDE